MADCCSPSPYDRQFDAKEARSNVRRYRRKGLDPLARRMVDVLIEGGLQGETVLEVGGGVGAVQIELLKGGAASTTNVEMSGEYEESARELLAAEGLAERVARFTGDFAEEADRYEPADHVFMNRVVCCYHDMPKLMGAAVTRARRSLAVSFPRDRWLIRMALRVANALLRLRRTDFRVFVHSPAGIISVATSRGFRVAHEERSFMWRAVVFEKV